MNFQIFVFLAVSALAKEALAATTLVTSSENLLSSQVRGQRNFDVFGSMGSGFGAAALGVGSGVGVAAEGIGSGLADAIHGKPDTVVQAPAGGTANTISIAINNGNGGSANSASAAENQNQ